MPYQVRTTEHFDKQLSKLDKFTGRTILKWRYQVGDYRIICQIEDDQLIVLALEVGHRKKVYKS